MTLARACVLPSRSLPDMKSVSSTTRVKKERSRSDTTQPNLFNTLSSSSATTTTTLDTEPRRISNASLMSNPFIGLMAGRKSVCHSLLHNEVELKIIVEPRNENFSENCAQNEIKSSKISIKRVEKETKIDNSREDKEQTLIRLSQEDKLQKHYTDSASSTGHATLITKPPLMSDKSRRRGLKQRGILGGSNVFEAYQNSIQERANTNVSVASVKGSRSTPSSPSGSRRVSWADDDNYKAKTERSAFERGSRTRVTWSVGKSSANSRIDREIRENSRISQNEGRSANNNALNVDFNLGRRSPSPVGLGQSFRRFGRKWLGINKL